MTLMGMGIEPEDFGLGVSLGDYADYEVIRKDWVAQMNKALLMAEEFIGKQGQLIDAMMIVANGIRGESEEVDAVWAPVKEEIFKQKKELDEFAKEITRTLREDYEV